MVGSTTTNGIVLGTPFIRQFYTYFDFVGQQIGFAPALNRPTLNPMTTGNVSVGWIAVSTILTTFTAIALVISVIWA